MMNPYGMGAQCVPCVDVRAPRGEGLGAIVMQPLRGGLAQGEEDDIAIRFGFAGPLALMGGAAITYGGVTAAAARSWKKGFTGAILGAGLVGVLAGGTVAVGGGAAAEAAGVGREAYLTAGLPAVGVGIALLAWGGWRAWKKK